MFGLGAPGFYAAGQSDAGHGGRCGAELPDAEVISADSMQAYRGMDIGTAKPDPALDARLPHHLIDIRNPDEQYTAGDFVALADALCDRIAASGKLPVVSGGTGFYLKNFICGLPSSPPADPGLRAAVQRDLAEKGIGSLRAELAARDPDHAARIGLRDEYRITRAVEILRATGRRPAEFAAPDTARDRFDFLVLGVARSREDLYARIEARVDSMFESGLEGEVAALLAAGHGAGAPGMSAIGYREFLEMPGASRGEIAAAIKANTRRYAKRQMTFFRRLPGIQWIDASPEALVAKLA